MKIIIKNIKENHLEVTYDIKDYKKDIKLKFNENNLSKEELEKRVREDASKISFLENEGMNDLEDYPFWKDIKIKKSNENTYHSISDSTVFGIYQLFEDDNYDILNKEEMIREFYEYITNKYIFDIEYQL